MPGAVDGPQDWGNYDRCFRTSKHKHEQACLGSCDYNILGLGLAP